MINKSRVISLYFFFGGGIGGVNLYLTKNVLETEGQTGLNRFMLTKTVFFLFF